MPEQTQGAGNALTDGTGVSPITAQKLLKDGVADFLLSAAAAIATANITGLQDVVSAPEVAAFAIAGAAVRALYRVALRWATS